MRQNFAKTYLRSIRSEQREIRVLTEMRENVYLSLLPPAIRYDKDKVQVSPEDMVSERMARVCELDKEIDKRLAILDLHRAEAFRKIQEIENDNGRTVLLLYYLQTKKDGKSYKWSDVAKDMSYSEENVKKIHGRALQELNKIM